MNKYIQDFLPNLLETKTEDRNEFINETERQLHLAKQFCRYEKQLRVCKSPTLQRMLEKAKADVIRLMERS